MFSNVGKSIVFLCHQTRRRNPGMFSEIEEIIIKDKGKIYEELKMDPSAYIFVFVLTFLRHKVTHVLFSGWGHIPLHLMLVHMLPSMLVVRTSNQQGHFMCTWQVTRKKEDLHHLTHLGERQ